MTHAKLYQTWTALKQRRDIELKNGDGWTTKAAILQRRMDKVSKAYYKAQQREHDHLQEFKERAKQEYIQLLVEEAVCEISTELEQFLHEITSFQDLHKYCDANEYLYRTGIDRIFTDEPFNPCHPFTLEVLNAVQETLNEWLTI